MKIKPLYLILGVLVILLGWGGYKAWCAHKNLVTLNVRNMDIRKVIKKIEWQTWETVLVHKDLQGKVTLKVHKVPLNEVLNIIGEQLSARWTAMYPLYRSSKSLDKFEKSVVGMLEPETHGWTNLQSRGFGFGGRGGGPGGPGGFGFAEMMRGQNELVSLSVTGKELDLTLMALARFAQAQVVPEDGVAGSVSLTLRQVPFDKAVKALASRVKTKWEKYYSLRGFGERGGPEMFASEDGGGRRGFRGPRDDNDGGERRRFGPPETVAVSTNAADTNQVVISTNTPTTNNWAAMREQRRERFEQVQQIVQDSMTPEQRQQMENMRNNPEQFREQMRTRFAGQMQNRARNNIKNTTPEQRVQRDVIRKQRMAEWEARRAQQQPPGR